MDLLGSTSSVGDGVHTVKMPEEEGSSWIGAGGHWFQIRAGCEKESGVAVVSLYLCGNQRRQLVSGRIAMLGGMASRFYL